MSYGNMIKTKRKELGLTQTELSEAMNVSSLVVSQWESDEVLPSNQELEMLSKILMVSFTNEAQVVDVAAPITIKEDIKVVNDTVSKALDEYDNKEHYYCNKCGKSDFNHEVFQKEFLFKNEKKTICLCQECEDELEKKVNEEVKRNISLKNKKKRIKAFVIQLITLLIFLAFVLGFGFNNNYVGAIIFGIFGLLLSTTIACCILNNIAIICQWRGLRNQIVEFEYDAVDEVCAKPILFLVRRRRNPYLKLLFLETPLIFVISVFLYPVAIYRNIWNKMPKKSILSEIQSTRSYLYISILYNSNYKY